MPFALPNSPELSEISEAVNYLLGNFGANMAADPVTGQITGPTGIVIAYLYKYLAVKYADSPDGVLNFTNTPTNRAYYGLRNSNDSAESTNPADYVWYKVDGGFSTTKFLFYQTTGGRQIDIVVATTNPTPNYVQDDGTAIDLDSLTAGRGQQVAYPTIYKWTSTNTAPARPSVTTTFTWATGEYGAPATWGVTPPTPVSGNQYLWAITVPLSASINEATSVCDWTNTDYVIYKISENGTNGLSFINAYKVQNQSLPTPTFTTPTSGATVPAGWVSTAPAVAVGQVIWYIQGQYNSSDITLDGVAPNTTAWTGPIAASVFQDIRSDNWNGSNPPIAGNPATWGTAGYYIERTSGSTYLNNLFARGTLQSGTTPAISGTTMTGSGGVINSTGTFAFGNSTTNISFNGTQMTLNGNVVATGNINLNAVTLSASAFTSAVYRNTATNTWQTAQTITITTNGSQVYISSYGNPLVGSYLVGPDLIEVLPEFRLVRGSTVLITGNRSASMNYSETPAAGTYVYTLQIFMEPVAGTIVEYTGVSNRSLFAIETKR